MKNIILLLALLLLMGLVGCESEADKQAQVLAQQHHLFNIQQCKAETKQADNALGDILKSNTDGGQGNHITEQHSAWVQQSTPPLNTNKQSMMTTGK
jgi:hypothetical protein